MTGEAGVTLRYVGMDVHEAATSICTRDRAGKIVEERVIPTTAAALRRYFPRGRRRRWAVTFEEGPLAQWIFETLDGRVGSVVVCNPRYNRLVSTGTKTDRIDAAKLAELLRLGAVRPVHHVRRPAAIREFVTHYDTLVVDVTRAMARIRAIYRAVGLQPDNVEMYTRRGRRRWLARIRAASTRHRLDALYVQCDTTSRLRDEARVAMVTEAASHPAYELLQTIPHVGPVRAAQLLALIATRYYPTDRHLVSYAGLAVAIRASGEYTRDLQKSATKPRPARGLARQCNPLLKRVLKDIALAASHGRGPLRAIYDGYIARGLATKIARVAVARRIAVIVFAMLRHGEAFDPGRISPGT